jgi:hypothetical protein
MSDTKIQIEHKEDLSEMSDDLILKCLLSLVKTNLSPEVEKLLLSIKSLSGDEAYRTTRESFLEIIQENIAGVKAMKIDLITFIRKNNGKKFKIKIELDES